MSDEELKARIAQALDENRYYPMNDVLFKFVFGKVERKNITIDFLNSVLEPSLGHSIKDIRFISTEIIPQSEEEKLSRLDVACELDTGERIDVEVQVVNYHNMQRRTLYYWSGMYLMHLLKGEDYQQLRPVITINILAFRLLPQEEPHAMYGVYNPETGERLNNDLEIHFLEIPKFINKPVKDMTKMERWMAYFSGKLNLREKEELAMSEAAIHDAFDATQLFFQTKEDRLKYLNRQMAIMDYRSGLRWAKDHGEERMARLANAMKEAGRIDEFFKAASDPILREQLFQEFHLDDFEEDGIDDTDIPM